MYKYLIAFILFSFTLLFSQSSESGGQPEIYATSISYDVGNLFIERISVTYCNAVESDDYFGGSAVTPLNSNGKAGWGLCTVGDPKIFYLYGWGVYRVYAKGTSHYFYLDMRDLNYPNGRPDFKIEFNYSGYSAEKYFRWSAYNNPIEWKECNDNSVKQIWKGRGASEPDVSGFPSDYWSKCLVVGKTDFDPPHPIWSKYPGFTNIDSYQLYRGMVDLNSNTVPNDDDFILVATENNTVFDYEDNDDDYVLDINKIGGWPYIALYYVKAKSGTTLSPRTNIVPVFSLIPWSNALILINEKNNIT